MRFREATRCILLGVILLMLFFISQYSDLKRVVSLEKTGLLEKAESHTVVRSPFCGPPLKCPDNHFAFYLRSGVANAVGPRICFEGKTLMSGITNNIGTGLNIVFVNGETGKVEKIGSFNMYSGDPNLLLLFFDEIKPGTIVLVASYDDSATKMTDKIRDIFTSLGSKQINTLKYRDTWVFAGASKFKSEINFEKLAHNVKETNIFDGWPKSIDLLGCFPRISAP